MNYVMYIMYLKLCNKNNPNKNPFFSILCNIILGCFSTFNACVLKALCKSSKN